MDDYDDPLDISLPRRSFARDLAGGFGYGLGTVSLGLFLVALVVAAVLFVVGLLCAVTWILLFVTLVLWYLGLWGLALLNAAGTAAGLAGTALGYGDLRALPVAVPGLLLNAAALAGELYLLAVVHHVV